MWGNSGRRLKTLLCGWLVFCLLLPCSCWGDVVLSEAEWTRLNQSLETSDKALAKAQEKLEQSDEKLAKAEQKLAIAEQKLEKAENRSAELEKKSQQQELGLQKASKYLKQQEREARAAKVKALFIGLGIGAVGGFCGGFYLAKYK